MGNLERFDQTSMRLRYNTLLYVPVFLVPAVVNVLMLMWFTRLFAPHIYGNYTLVVNTTIIISSLLSQWISLSVHRFRPEYKRDGLIWRLDSHLSRLLWLMIVGVILFSIWGYVFLKHVIGPYRMYYWSAVLSIISAIVFTICGSVYQIDLKTKEYRNLYVWQSFLKLPLIFVWFMVAPVNPIAFIVVPAILQLIFSIPMMNYIKFIESFCTIFKDWRLFFDFVLGWVRYGFPLIGWYIGTTVLNLTDRYMMEYFRTSREVGIYSANFTIAVQSLALVCNPLFFAIQSLTMNEATHVRQDEIERRIREYTRLYVMIVVPFGGYFSVFRTEVSTILLGKEFSQGASAIPILIIGFFFWNLALYGQLCYQIVQKTNVMFYFVAIAAFVNFTANVYLIPTLGTNGAALATSFSFLLYACLLYFASFRYMRWRVPWASLWKCGGIAIGLGLLLEKWRIVISHTASGFVGMGTGIFYFFFYMLFLFVLKEWHVPSFISGQRFISRGG
ncbi:O-antigen/teichoic acid export membrane protein [Anoxybacillus tengchongensis]|uniref:O-antigen/teichoic acid export membrane protein n=1 Tax=Anoxybacillus tengchongensis TaxID=576944 RepID=A0A7W9YPZ7_9BACL|nr:polysaccharide biosynthesis C-terminal domain-containing protein [Anoxybacillus tengchongensis]MBB6176077.1 O-antigen/teichoic acid export membrane protein [Anoxybacillus tengchongensis]